MDRGFLPRLAWFTPLPPARSGIAQYSAELLPYLAERFEMDVFLDAVPAEVQTPAGTSVRSAHDFVWLHARRPFDLVVYQLGNGGAHDYMWGYLARYPGLVVMHDGQFHHARGHLLRDQRRFDDYDAEFAFNHPGLPSDVAELGASGRLGRLFFLWPMRRVVLESARMIAVHNRWLAQELRIEAPHARVEAIDMGVPAFRLQAGARVAVRRRHGIGDDDVVFLALGEVTPEKRIPEILRQLSSISAQLPGIRLLIAGSPVSHFSARDEAVRYGVDDRVICAGFLDHEEVDRYIEAADACLCLRWPTSRETSAAWLRCLAAGKATVITDLAHTADVPAYDPRSWTVLPGGTTRVDAAGWPTVTEPACIAVDLLDEGHSLNIAMHRLATNPLLRIRLGRHARLLWEERFTLDRMAAGYIKLLETALATPRPDQAQLTQLPQHFHQTGAEHATRLIESVGLTQSDIDGLWRVGRAR
jgi:glycosyltransferase involved in cell wall biosynthesis